MGKRDSGENIDGERTSRGKIAGEKTGGEKTCYLINCTKSDILTNRLVSLLVDWNGNSLLFTKQLHMMNIIIDFS